jgi:pyruvate dehydrogenase E2 component (dihydrolipoamide acetyltransferase)
MAEIVTMPKLGFDMAEGTLIRWVIKEGEPVAKGAVLAEIETDKATVEVESNFEGILLRHLVGQGDIVPVNDPIAVIGSQGETVDISAITGETPPPKQKKDAPPAGQPQEQPETPPQAAPTASQQDLPAGVRASPLARRMASEHEIDLLGLQGSGPGGRIVKRDIENYIEQKEQVSEPAKEAPVKAAPSAAPQVPLPAYLPAGETPADQHVPLNRLRAAIGRRMAEVKGPVPHFYVTHEYKMDALMTLRKQVNALLPEEDKVSVNDFVVKATALALRQFPNLNATLNGDEIIRFGAVNVGIAVAVEGGLLTVVCRDADRKPVRQVALEVRAMVERVRQGKVRPDDIEGSTFSVSNLGMFDVESFIAIINPPEAAILAVGTAKEVPVVENGEVKPAWRMKATISVDHRISDGVEAAKFLQVLAQYLEQPLYLLI